MTEEEEIEAQAIAEIEAEEKSKKEAIAKPQPQLQPQQPSNLATKVANEKTREETEELERLAAFKALENEAIQEEKRK